MITTNERLINLGQRYKTAKSMLCSFNEVFYPYEMQKATEAMRLFRLEDAFSMTGNVDKACAKMDALENAIDYLRPQWSERMSKKPGNEWMTIGGKS